MRYVNNTSIFAWTICLFGISFAFLPLPLIRPAIISLAWAQEQLPKPKLDIESRLQEIREQVSHETNKLEQSEERIARLEIALSQKRSEVDSVRKEEDKLSSQLDSVSEKLTKVRSSIEETSQQVESLGVLSSKRIRALYMNRSGGVMNRLVLPTSTDDFFRSSYLISKVRAFDRDTLLRLQELKEKYESQEKVFEELTSEHTKILQGISARRASLTKALREKESSIQKLKSEKAESERILLSLQAGALRLETVVASLTGETDQPEARVEKRAEEREASENVEFEGEGLSKSTDSLVLPVSKGRVIREFGKKRHGRFSDLVFSKGIEYSLPEGEAVRAIAAGRVMFRGRMPGYDRIVIVDHGKRYYSLYGRLHDFTVNVGDIVSKSDKLGLVGAPNEKDRNFYFEIRQKGSPVDPAQFFGKKLAPEMSDGA